MSEEFKIDDTVDVTDVKCPTTFVKAKVAIEELDEGGGAFDVGDVDGIVYFEFF